jgi:hypothetical protein
MRQEGEGGVFVRPNAWRRTLPLALAAVALVAFASAALAEPDPWQQAAARVEFPIYRPAVTLGFAPGPVVVERCGDSGNTWVRASYSEGSGDRKAVFGFDESYPRHCGDAGERMTVTSADINGVVVPVAVYCYSPGPKCTVADGFANGFHIELRPPGAKTPMIGVYTARVALPDLLRMVRSLTRVPASLASAPTTPATAGPCSKAEATRVVRRLHLGNADDPDVREPVAQVLCGAFVGPGTEAMVASLSIPSCGRTGGWVVLRRPGATWQLVMERNNGADLDAVGMGIRETQFVLRPGDAHCFPTGGTRSRTWRWNGSRFTSGPWTRSKPATPKTPSSTRPSGYLKTPSNNIACVYWLGTAPPSIRCRIASGLVPEPRTDRAGCPRTDDVVLRTTGRPTIGGRSICRGEDEGDAGPLAALPVARVLAYGKTWAGEGLRCTSAETGLTCRNRDGHGFFLSRERWRAFPG